MASNPFPDPDMRTCWPAAWDPAQLLLNLEEGHSIEEVLLELCRQAEQALQGHPVWLGTAFLDRSAPLALATSNFPRELALALDTIPAPQVRIQFAGCEQEPIPSDTAHAPLAEVARTLGFGHWAWSTHQAGPKDAYVTLLVFAREAPIPKPTMDTLASLSAFALRLHQEAMSPMRNQHWQELARRVFRALPEPALLVDALTGGVLDANLAACQLYGHTASTFRSLTLQGMTDQRQQPETSRRRLHLRADGTPLVVEVTSTPFLEGPRPMALLLVRDATVEAQTEHALRESEARYRGLFESAPVSIWEEDFSSVKTYLDALGLDLQRDIATFLQAHPLHLQACLDRIQVRNTNLKTLELYGVSEHPNLFSHLSCLCAEGTREVLGRELTAFRQGQLTVETEIRTATSQGDPRDIVLVARLAPGAEHDWSRLLVSIVDMTERNRAIEETRRSRASLSEAQAMAEMGSCEMDLRSGEVFWSKGAYRLLKLPQEHPAPYVRTILRNIHPEDRRVFFHAQREMLRHGSPMDVELRITAAASEAGERHMALKVRTERDEDGIPVRLVGVFQDITRRKQMEASLRQSEAGYRRLAEENAELLARFRQEAEEKSMLLQEVNHRVKNNLTSILGMLDMELQASLKAGNEAAYSFEDLKQRIFALASVHELLSAASWSPLRLESLATDLIRNTLAGSPVAHLVRVDVSPSREAVWVSPSSATALAMILAELTTNSVKYAFERRGSGRITLRIRPLKDERNRVCLTYQDDGMGYPEDVLAEQRDNVGLKLIRLNVRSLLRGELQLDNQRGARVRITFQPMPLTRTPIRRSET